MRVFINKCLKLSFWVSTTNTQCKENVSKYSRVKKQDIYSWFGKAEKHGGTKMIMDMFFRCLSTNKYLS